MIDEDDVMDIMFGDLDPQEIVDDVEGGEDEQ